MTLHRQLRPALKTFAAVVVAVAMLGSACAASTSIDETAGDPAPVQDTPSAASGESENEDPTSEQVPGEPDPGDSADPVDPVDPADLAPGEVQVRLLDAGDEPRTELRLMIAASCGEVMTMNQTIGIEQTIDGNRIPSLGEVEQVMEMRNTVAPTGDNFEINSEVLRAQSAPGTPPSIAQSMDVELAKIVGLTTSVTLTNRALQVEGTTELDGADALGPFADLIEGLTALQAPLPSEAVGVGARWETINVLEVQGLIVTNVAENEIVSIDGTVIEMQITGRQEIPEGSTMDLGGGLAADVVTWESNTAGTMVVDLATISPISSSATTTALQSFEAPASEGGGTLDQEIRTDVVITSAPDDGCTGRTTRP